MNRVTDALAATRTCEYVYQTLTLAQDGHATCVSGVFSYQMHNLSPATCTGGVLLHILYYTYILLLLHTVCMHIYHKEKHCKVLLLKWLRLCC